MADRVTRVEHAGVFQTLMESFKRVGVGVGMFFIAFPLMFWNECSSVSTAKSLEEGLGAVVSVEAAAIDAGNEGALVHLSGSTQTSETLTDSDFGVSAPALRLLREVEMYQWKQSSSTKEEGSTKTTTYSYAMAWADDIIDSQRFEEPVGHSNPGSMPYEDRALTAQTVTVGAFTLRDNQVSSLSASEKLTPQITSHPVHDGYIYLGGNPSSPSVGDVRISYLVLRPGPVSVIAQQRGTSFSPFETRAGKSIAMIEAGNRSAPEMFASAQASNTTGTWIMRVVAFFFVFVGMNLVLGPLRTMSGYVPLLGRVFSAGLTLVTFFLASALTLVTISMAWIVARPLLGIFLLLVGGGAFVGAAALIIVAARKAEATA
ncbi:MAG: hypothetical protein ACI8S6_000308 [Myxococcota bacterium]|jgi:hypothetical protein